VARRVGHAVLLIQSIPYLASLVVSLISAFDVPASVLGEGRYRTNQPAVEHAPAHDGEPSVAGQK
jgi:hypothetical protein